MAQNGTYVFSSHIDLSDDVTQASMRVQWLDRDYNLLEGQDQEIEFEDRGISFRVLWLDQAPAGARYAVPTIYKDNPGTLLADEMLFGPAGTECEAAVSAVTESG